MFGIKTSLSSEWKQRFSDVEKLNAYAETRSIEIKNAKLSDISVEGAKFSNGVFDDTGWSNVHFLKSEIIDTRFIGGEYRNVDFKESLIKNSVFENITFINADFKAASLQGVKFVNCNFGRADFQYLRTSDVVFEGAVLEEVQFYKSGLDVTIIGSKLTEVEMMSITAQEKLIINDSDIYDVNLGNSIIPYVEITGSKVAKATYSSGKSEKLVMKNLKGALQASGAVIDYLEIGDVDTEVLFFSGITSERIKVERVNVTDSLNAKATAESLEITDSNINAVWNSASQVGLYAVKNTNIGGSNAEYAHFKTMHFENVQLNGQFNFSHARADKLELINVIKGPDFQFLGDESNISF